jgi:hypothetical protein
MTIRIAARRTGPLVIRAVALLALAGCAKEVERAPQRPDSTTSPVATPVTPATRDSSAAAAAPATPPTPAPASTSPSPTYTVTEHGIGPLRAGMTFDEADAALHGALLVPVEVDTTGCDYLVWDGGPSGVHVMFDQHRVARIDVDTASIATAAGARVGDDEARIKRLYPGVVVTPHKYVDGHYLTVTPTAPADKRYRLIFETAGGRVTRYRAGMLPSVEYVEGCS